MFEKLIEAAKDVASLHNELFIGGSVAVPLDRMKALKDAVEVYEAMGDTAKVAEVVIAANGMAGLLNHMSNVAMQHSKDLCEDYDDKEVPKITKLQAKAFESICFQLRYTAQKVGETLNTVRISHGGTRPTERKAGSATAADKSGSGLQQVRDATVVASGQVLSPVRDSLGLGEDPVRTFEPIHNEVGEGVVERKHKRRAGAKHTKRRK